MSSLLEDFYSEDLNDYSQTNGPGTMDRTLYQDENGQIFYYTDDNPQDEGSYYYVDENGRAFYYVDEAASNEQYYYVDENGQAFYYVNEDSGDVVEEVIYYDDDEQQADPQMFFKKEIHVSNGPINTPKDNMGNSWDAASYERDREIQRIADEEGLSYGDAYKEFGRRYEVYEPNLSDYI